MCISIFTILNTLIVLVYFALSFNIISVIEQWDYTNIIYHINNKQVILIKHIKCVSTQIACKRYINVCIWLEPFDFGYG